MKSLGLSSLVLGVRWSVWRGLRTRSKIRLVALAVVSAFTVAVSGPQPVEASPFTCAPNVYLSQGPNSGQDLYELTFPGGATDLGLPIRPSGVTASQGTFNAIGFREEDGYIYGLDRDENLIRIESDGQHVSLGVPMGLPLLPGNGNSSNYVAGTVGPNGLYYVASQTGASVVHVIDIDLVEVVDNIPRPATFNGADFVIDALGHFAYVYNSGDTRRLSLTDDSGFTKGTVRRFGSSTGENGTYGAAYLDANNRFFISNNDSNNVYEIDLSLDPSTGLPNGTPTLAATGTFSVDRNDGAFCPGASFPVGGDPTNLTVLAFIDVNGNDAHDTGEPFYDGGDLELEASGNSLSTGTTNANGRGNLNNLSAGKGRQVRMRKNGRLIAERANVVVVSGATTEVLLPIDPSGKIYDAATRDLIAGATVTMTNSAGTALPIACFSPTTQQNQVTAADGYYRFDLVPGADALCPVAETEYRIAVDASGFDAQPSGSIPPQSGAYNPTGATTNEIVANSDRPVGAEPTTHYTAFLLASGDPDVVNNHIALDATVAALPPASTTLEFCAAPLVGVFEPEPHPLDSQVFWLGNNPTGTRNATLESTPPSIDPVRPSGTDFASADPFVTGAGISSAFTNGDNIALNGIDQASAEAALANGDYMEFSFTTAADMPFGRALYNFARSSGAGRSGFDMTLLVSDDPTFATAHTVVLDAGVTVAARTYHSFTAPIILKPGTTYYMRLLSYNNNTSSGLVGHDDIFFSTQLCADYSDAPEDYADTTHAGQIQTATLFLGASLSNDIGEIASADATSDGATDDGVAVPTLTAGATSDVTIAAADITGEGTGTLHSWIDFNDDGSFDTTEYATTPFDDGATSDLVFTSYGTTAAAGETFARFRLTTDALTNADASTAASDGEVEDYLVTIEMNSPPPLASCAGNPPGYVDLDFSTLTNDVGVGTGRTWSFINAASYLGESIDINVEVLSLTGTDDFDSISSSTSKAATVMKTLTAGGASDETEAEIRWSFVRSSDQTAIAISTEIEFGDIDLRASRLESILVNRADYDGYSVVSGAEIEVSSDGIVDRFDGKIDDSSLSTQAVKFTLHNRTSFTWRQRMDRLGSGSSGRAGFDARGQVFQVDNCPRYDFSDADVAAEARHNAFSDLTLGASIDAEVAALTSANAGGDGDDDDGIAVPTLTAGTTSDVTIAAADITGEGSGTLYAWIDFNDDGSFDTAEYATTPFDDGAIADLVFTSYGTTAAAGETFARFRLTTDALTNADAATAASDGEVEDYQVTISALSGPPFPPGPGLTASVCEVAPATNPWQDIGLRWEFNGGSPAGSSPDARIDNSGIFASATVGSYVGINAQINGFDLNIDADSIPASYDDTKYIQYQFTTAAFGNNAELTGAGWTLFEAEQPGHDQDTGAYSFAILIDDDPSFGSPEVWFNEMSFDGVDDSAAAASTGVGYPGNYAQNFAHFDPTGTTITLSPSTTYTMRVYPYDVTRFGDDNGQPYTNIVLWDDFMPKAVSCAATEDRSDAPVAGVAPDGGSTVAYGEAQHTVTAGLQLGDAIDIDGASIANANASGDGADDDGISAFPVLETGASGYTLPAVNVRATGNGTLHGWIDFDGDGAFETSEHTFISVTSGTLSGDLIWSSSVTNTSMISFARFRLTSDTLTSADFATAASDGEVEDYTIVIATPPNYTLNESAGGQCAAMGGTLNPTNLFTDLDGGSFGTGSGEIDEIPATNPYAAQIAGGTYKNNFTGFGNGDYSIISNHQVPRNVHQHGSGIYDPVNGVTGRFFLSDPDTNAPTFSSTLSGLTLGQSYEVSFWVADSELNTDKFQRIGIFADGVEVYNTGFVSNTTSTMEWKKFAFVYTHLSAASTVSFDIRALEAGASGRDIFFDEIGIYECFLPQNDFSDLPVNGETAPDGSNVTAYGDAEHKIVLGLQLGASVDADFTSIASLNASGDGADDDGVAFPASLTPGSTVTVPVNVSGSGFLNAWVDWNGNGVFDGIEQVAVDVQDVSGTGAINLPVTVPFDAHVGTTFARFRWSTAFNIGSTGEATDGEVEDYQITIGAGGTMLSGRIFIDNGLGGVVSHDGQIAGGELSGAFGSIALLDGSGNPLATAIANPDGTWTSALPAGYSGSVELVTTASPGYRTISEDRSSLSGVGNTSETDGRYSFNVAAGISHTGMNIGVVADPTLTQNQTASVIPGQTTDLAHVYTATTSGTVTFGLVDQIANPAGAFASTLFEDTNCDGAPDQFLSGPKTVSAGQQICLVASTQASAGVGPSASYSYGVTASTAFAGTTETHFTRNDDAIGAGTGQELVLRKLVANLTKASGEGTTNTGDIGDVLRYRIVMSNPSGEAAVDVVVYDETPAYTALNGPIPSPIILANGVTCALAVPASNVAGYSGPLQWNCPGSFPPGGEGSVTFDVQISP